MRTRLKSFFETRRRKRARRMRKLLRGFHESQQRSEQWIQLALMQQHRIAQHLGARIVSLSEVGATGYSQTDEDGILLYLFSVLGVTNKRCVEICAGDGIQCNTANLILNHGWSGLLVDGNPERVARGREFYASHAHTKLFPPTFVHAWITRENVDALLREHDFVGGIDLLSIDVDGIDYWLWEAISAIEPRVVVIEFRPIFGPERACTVPYSAEFVAPKEPSTDGLPNYAGASLLAMVKLGRRKGFRFVGCNSMAFNAFFVREDLAGDRLPEASVAACLDHPRVLHGIRKRLPTVEHLPWVEV